METWKVLHVTFLQRLADQTVRSRQPSWLCPHSVWSCHLVISLQEDRTRNQYLLFSYLHVTLVNSLDVPQNCPIDLNGNLQLAMSVEMKPS